MKEKYEGGGGESSDEYDSFCDSEFGDGGGEEDLGRNYGGGYKSDSSEFCHAYYLTSPTNKYGTSTTRNGKVVGSTGRHNYQNGTSRGTNSSDNHIEKIALTLKSEVLTLRHQLSTSQTREKTFLQKMRLLESRVEDGMDKICGLRGKVGVLRRRNDELKGGNGGGGKVLSLEVECSRLVKEGEILVDCERRLKGENEVLIRENERMKRMVEQTKSENGNSGGGKGFSDRLTKDEVKLLDNERRLKRENEALLRENDNLKRRISSLEQTISGEQGIKALRGKIDGLEDENINLKNVVLRKKKLLLKQKDVLEGLMSPSGSVVGSNDSCIRGDDNTGKGRVNSSNLTADSLDVENLFGEEVVGVVLGNVGNVDPLHSFDYGQSYTVLREDGGRSEVKGLLPETSPPSKNNNNNESDSKNGPDNRGNNDSVSEQNELLKNLLKAIVRTLSNGNATPTTTRAAAKTSHSNKKSSSPQSNINPNRADSYNPDSQLSSLHPLYKKGVNRLLKMTVSSKMKVKRKKPSGKATLFIPPGIGDEHHYLDDSRGYSSEKERVMNIRSRSREREGERIDRARRIRFDANVVDSGGGGGRRSRGRSPEDGSSNGNFLDMKQMDLLLQVLGNG